MVEKDPPRRRTTTAVSSRSSCDMEANGGRTAVKCLYLGWRRRWDSMSVPPLSELGGELV